MSASFGLAKMGGTIACSRNGLFTGGSNTPNYELQKDLAEAPTRGRIETAQVSIRSDAYEPRPCGLVTGTCVYGVSHHVGMSVAPAQLTASSKPPIT
jgi:hypothetical protein